MIAPLRRLNSIEVSTLPGIEENIEFRLPAELRAPQKPVPAMAGSAS